MRQPIGRVHSVETLGTHDGPGLRCVFFLAGCNYRCAFCQNPDTWSCQGSSRMTLKEARTRLETLLPYLRQHDGGITASGGEPTLQAPFVTALFELAHRLKLKTALDTNGSCSRKVARKLLEVTDLALLDIKASEEKLHQTITGQSLAPVLAFGREAAELPGRLTIRRVLLPGINDAKAEIERLVEYIVSLKNIPPIELIPYHNLGVHKWKELGLRYPLKTLKPPTAAVWQRVARQLEEKGLVVF
ncbi:pyruvate formate lyase-activating protein [bacterium]|nr:pyruvate formate lyase-activating protein [bacterium]